MRALNQLGMMDSFEAEFKKPYQKDDIAIRWVWLNIYTSCVDEYTK